MRFIICVVVYSKRHKKALNIIQFYTKYSKLNDVAYKFTTFLIFTF